MGKISIESMRAEVEDTLDLAFTDGGMNYEVDCDHDNGGVEVKLKARDSNFGMSILVLPDSEGAPSIFFDDSEFAYEFCVDGLLAYCLNMLLFKVADMEHTQECWIRAFAEIRTRKSSVEKNAK